MDPNANAVSLTPEVALQGPATQTPIAEASPVVANTEAPATPETNGLQLDADTQKYLDNQNIAGTPSEVIVALVRRNQSLRNTPKVEEPKETVAEVLKQEPAPQGQPVQQHKLNDMDIMTTKLLVEKQYPDVQVDSNFYKEMINDGFNPMNGEEIDLNRVFKFAAMKQKLADADKAIASAAQPAPIPSPMNTVSNNLAPVQQMDKNTAERIIVLSTQERRYGRAGHPQYQEAVEFLQNLQRSSK